MGPHFAPGDAKGLTEFDADCVCPATRIAVRKKARTRIKLAMLVANVDNVDGEIDYGGTYDRSI